MSVLDTEKILITVKEASVLLSLAKSTIYAYVQNGMLKAVCLPHAHKSKARKRNRTCLRFRVADIEEFSNNLPGWAPNIEEVLNAH